ncbi:hypothetical protein [Clostridium sp. JNZ J1-5]
MEEKKSIFEKFRLVDKVNKEEIVKIPDEQDIHTDKNNNELNIINEKEEMGEVVEVKRDIELNSPKDSTEKEVNKLLSVDEIYNRFNIENKKINTIFLIDSYVKALPETLPTDIKKQSVLNIVKASGMNVQELIKDGQDRVKVLGSFTSDVSAKTKSIIDEYEKEIGELLKKIDEYKNIINNRKNFQEEQKACIDYEVQKINNIIGFIK